MHKYIFSILGIAGLLIAPAKASITFEKTFGDSLWDKGYSVVQTSDGGYIITGYTVSYGAGGYPDVYLIKTDSIGDIIWTKTFGGAYSDKSHSIARTFDGGYIIAGWTSSFGAGVSDVYLIKIDSSGDTLWTKTFGGIYGEVGHSIAQTSDTGYIIAGWTSSFGAGESDVYLIKTDSLGDTIWTKIFGDSEADYGYSVAQTTDGGYIITGMTLSYGAGGYDVYLIKTTSSGDTLWTKTFGGIAMDEGYSVVQTTDGGYIITGYTYSYGAGSIDVWLIKTNSSGDTLWTKTFGGIDSDWGRSLQQTQDGGYIITGKTNSYGAGTPYYSNVYLIKIDSSGDTLWTKTFGGIYLDEGYSVCQTSDRGYIIAGWTESYGAGYDDIYLIKTDSLGNVYGIEEKEKSEIRTTKSEIMVYPNPFTAVTSVKWSGISEANLKGCPTIQIYDLCGRLVKTLTTNHLSLTPAVTWDGRDNAGKKVRSGVYFCRLFGGGDIVTKRVTVIR